MEATFWDQRYGGTDFAYGEQPNVFVRDAAKRYLQPGSHVVELASGEGRNVAYLASQGHNVTAVDFSQSGLQKTLALAQRHDCAARVTLVQADILAWEPPSCSTSSHASESAPANVNVAATASAQAAPAAEQVAAGPAPAAASPAGSPLARPVDCVVLSFCHVLAEQRPGLMAKLAGWLRPGGHLIMEVFHPNQITKGYRQTSGGPHDPGMMVTLGEMRTTFAALPGQELEGGEVEYELHEGQYHEGVAAVTRFVWRRAVA